MPVYCDNVIIIFIKNTDENKDIIERFKLSKEYVYNTIIYRITKFALYNTVSPRPLMSLGEAFYKMGRYDDAVIAYKYAFKRLPSHVLENRLREIETEMKKKKEI